MRRSARRAGATIAQHLVGSCTEAQKRREAAALNRGPNPRVASPTRVRVLKADACTTPWLLFIQILRRLLYAFVSPDAAQQPTVMVRLGVAKGTPSAARRYAAGDIYMRDRDPLAPRSQGPFVREPSFARWVAGLFAIVFGIGVLLWGGRSLLSRPPDGPAVTAAPAPAAGVPAPRPETTTGQRAPPAR
jgi:hypothetical protein